MIFEHMNIHIFNFTERSIQIDQTKRLIVIKYDYLKSDTGYKMEPQKNLTRY